MTRGEKIKQAWKDGRYARRDMSQAGRPKGVKDTGPRNYSEEGLLAMMSNGHKTRELMVARGTIGWPKGRKPSITHKKRNSKGVLNAIEERRFSPKKNINKFIAESDGSEKYWRTRVNHGTHGSFYSKKNRKVMYYDSSWELARMKFLDQCEDVKHYRRQPVQIPYSLNGKAHYYRPDLLVEYMSGLHVLEEIKPAPMLDRPEVKAKFQAARAFCKVSNLQFRVLCSLEACLEY